MKALAKEVVREPMDLISHPRWEDLKREVEDMLAMGVIEPLTSG